MERARAAAWRSSPARRSSRAQQAKLIVDGILVSPALVSGAGRAGLLRFAHGCSRVRRVGPGRTRGAGSGERENEVDGQALVIIIIIILSNPRNTGPERGKDQALVLSRTIVRGRHDGSCLRVARGVGLRASKGFTVFTVLSRSRLHDCAVDCSSGTARLGFALCCMTA